MGQIETLFNNGQFDKAVPLLEQALERDASQLGLRHFLGIALVRSGQTEKGLEHLEYTVKSAPDNVDFIVNYAMVLEDEGNLSRAVGQYEKALELDPSNDEVCSNLGRVYIELRRGHEAYGLLAGLLQRHPKDDEVRLLFASSLLLMEDYPNALAYLKTCIKDDPNNSHLQTQYALALSKIGHADEAIKLYLGLINESNENAAVAMELASTYERTHDLEQAEQWANKTISFNDDLLKSQAMLLLARLARREGDTGKAKEWLQKMEVDAMNSLGEALRSFESGKIFDAEKNYSEAFASFELGNKKMKDEVKCLKYDRQESGKRFARLKNACRKENLIDSASLGPELTGYKTRPIFIVGFPRSGTTLIEQILASHPNICPGGELRLILNIVDRAKEWSHSEQLYPECFTEIIKTGRGDLLKKMQEYYLGQVAESGVLEDGKNRFTDKMPLNLLHLPLIQTIFPGAPIVHVVRHPLDSCLSAYFTEFSNSHEYSFDLVDTAFHFKQCWDLAKHYRGELDMNYHQLKYENLVAQPEEQIRALLEFVDEPWDDRCLEFHKNKRVVGTASYEQVNRELYSDSVSRYKNYREQVNDIIPILEPIIEELGYTID